jgi:hypothetical protein
VQADLTGPFEVLSRIPNSTYRIYGLSGEPVRDVKRHGAPGAGSEASCRAQVREGTIAAPAPAGERGVLPAARQVAMQTDIPEGQVARGRQELHVAQEALYQAIIVRRTKALSAEATELAGAPDPGPVRAWGREPGSGLTSESAGARPGGTGKG